MKIERFPEWISEIYASNHNFRNYLIQLENGRPFTPRSWVYEAKPDEWPLQEWQRELKQLPGSLGYAKPVGVSKDSNFSTFQNTDYTSDIGEIIYNFEQSQVDKYGPQGGVEPVSKLDEIVTAGFNSAPSKPTLFKTREWKRAKQMFVEYVIQRLHIYHKLSPLPAKDVTISMSDRDTLSSNSGLPEWTKRSVPETLAHAIADAESGKCYEYPATALFRNYNNKTRLVWMYPMSQNISEGRFCLPLKDAITKSDLTFFAPWRGWSPTLEYISALYDKGELLSASDFSHTDEHFTFYHTLEVYDCIKHAFKEEYWPALKQSMLHINRIPLIVGKDRLLVGWHGVSSGSTWTNDIETYFDLILAFCMYLRNKHVHEPGYAIGDDMTWRLLRWYEQFSDDLEQIGKEAGVIINSSKVTNSPYYIKTLQRVVISGYYSTRTCVTHDSRVIHVNRGVYSTIRALKSLIYPENYHNPKFFGKDAHAMREIEILENCNDHPLFEKFVRFVAKGWPYLIKFVQLSDNELDKIQAKLRTQLPRLNPTYNQEKKDSKLSKFETVRVLRALSLS